MINPHKASLVPEPSQKRSRELSNLRQMMEVPDEPGLSPNNGLEERVPKRSVHGKQSPQGASKTFWHQDDQPCWQGRSEAPSANSLALVPLTPDDPHAPSLRRSSRDHKKPRSYYAASQVEPPDKPSISKGLQRGFLK
ncbi:TPA: hypothetical protein ACH3X2_001865 [Trebouxia sp. C0005]